MAAFFACNHDGECPCGRGADADGLAVWFNLMRKRYFPNPVPDAFYTGDGMQYPGAGLLQDYYAWEWGDALFLVLDPFWFTQRQRGQDGNWQRTKEASVAYVSSGSADTPAHTCVSTPR